MSMDTISVSTLFQLDVSLSEQDDVSGSVADTTVETPGMPSGGASCPASHLDG